ncbi:MAG TPA: TRAP transporter substrate-binding protein [Dehalococcoidales bacterium]|nr:TRAP transporter substrate-binding protein [Dehalococcoidales bacterium]
MKKWYLVLVAVILVSSLLVVSCSTATPTPSAPATTAPPATTAAPATTPAPTATTPAAPTKVFKFTYSNFFPATHLNSILAEMWINEIKTRTNGAVEISYFPGGALTAGAKIYDGVVQGISHIGMSVASYTAGRFPGAELIDMPHAYPSGWVATRVANDFYNMFKMPEFNETQVLYFHAHGPGVVFTTEKPVRKLEDMKGLVLRSTGVGAKVATALGASGYAAAQGEAYELMSKGVIQGSLSPREVLKGWKQAEVVKYVTNNLDVGYTATMFVVMNKTAWNSLPTNLQNIILEVSEKYAGYHGMVWTDYDKQAMDFFVTFPGREVINQDAAERARWVAAVKPLVDGYIAELKGKNLPADEWEKYINERVKYWTARAPTAEECSTWVAANVKKP